MPTSRDVGDDILESQVSGGDFLLQKQLGGSLLASQIKHGIVNEVGQFADVVTRFTRNLDVT